jgi:hypothetical protein
MAFLTMEDPSCSYAKQKQRLLARFPCNSAGSCAWRILPSKSPEPPRKSSNLSPEPIPNRAPARWPRGETGECRLGVRLSVRRVFWLVPHRAVRLPLRADGVGDIEQPRLLVVLGEVAEGPGR